MDNATAIYQNPAKYPNLAVPHYLVVEIVQVLALSDRTLQALKLIRGAYRREDGAWATLAEAEEIYRYITGRDARRQVETPTFQNP